MNKPTKPNIVIPESFAENGIKTDFDNEKLTNGFDRLQPDVLAGDNLNKLIDDTYKASNYALNLGDYVLGKNQITNCILEAPNGVATYSGNTITVKQGLKVLIPNGRNTDGTLNNIEKILSNDINITIDSSRNGDLYIYLNNDNTLDYWGTDSVGYYEKTPSVGLYWQYFNADLNVWKQTLNGSAYTDNSSVLVAKINVTSGNINSLTVFQPIDLLKRSDKSEVSGWSMPSKKRIDLTLGASGSIYTAPANGWITLNKTANPSASDATWRFVSMQNLDNYAQDVASQGPYNFALAVHMPIAKGQNFIVEYDAIGATNDFCFVYAEGEV